MIAFAPPHSARSPLFPLNTCKKQRSLLLLLADESTYKVEQNARRTAEPDFGLAVLDRVHLCLPRLNLPLALDSHRLATRTTTTFKRPLRRGRRSDRRHPGPTPPHTPPALVAPRARELEPPQEGLSEIVEELCRVEDSIATELERAVESRGTPELKTSESEWMKTWRKQRSGVRAKLDAI